MDDILYILIIIGLTIFVIFYGGHNDQNEIEYSTTYFNNLKYIINFEKKINTILDTNNDIFKDKNFVNINKYFNTTNIIIPNFINCFFIKINPYTVFNIYNIVDKKDIYTNMLIIFNHKKHNNLELLVDNDNMDLYPNINSIKTNHTNNTNYTDKTNNNGYFYDLEKVISITGVFHIYNFSNEIVVITCFVLKKPFWYN
jgi:hypothetical protein